MAQEEIILGHFKDVKSIKIKLMPRRDIVTKRMERDVRIGPAGLSLGQCKCIWAGVPKHWDYAKIREHLTKSQAVGRC